MAEYSIPVMFNVEADNREEAARIIADLLQNLNENMMGIEWWTIAPEDKHADRNDNAPGVVVFEADMQHYDSPTVVQRIYNALGYLPD